MVFLKKKSKTVEQNSSFQRSSRSLVTGVTTGSSPLPPGHIEGRLRWPTDIVSPVQLNGHTQTSALGSEWKIGKTFTLFGYFES